MFRLEPPPIDPELMLPSHDVDDDRDYAPDPVAEYVLTFPCARVFSVPALVLDLSADLRKRFGAPFFYVRTPAGRITYLQSTDAPSEGTALLAGWRLDDANDNAVQQIFAGAETLAEWLAARPEGFEPARPHLADLEAQHGRAGRIIAIGPTCVTILATPNAGEFDGRAVWDCLHSMGVTWGDGDFFQWQDPTNQTDYLFWAETEDDDFGFVVPEEVRNGRQHFTAVKFYFDVARTPHPGHVLDQMTRASQEFANHVEATVAYLVDDVEVDGPTALVEAVQAVVGQLASLGVKPGSHSACMLR